MAMMGGMPQQQQPSRPAQPYAFMYPSPPQQHQQHQHQQHQHQQHQQHQAPSQRRQSPASSASSRVVSEPTCGVYRVNEGSEAALHTAQQVVMADGRLFIEHIPGHNVVFVPRELPPSMALQRVAGSRVAKQRVRTPAQARPTNVFFKYRSNKQRELQEAHPRLNQTIISQMVAEHWRREPAEVKDKYKLEYKEEMRKYELSKKLRRNRPDPEYFEADDTTVRSDSLSYDHHHDMDGHPMMHEPMSLGISQPSSHSAAGAQRHRSFTLPTDSAQQLGINRLIH
ncbi:hypothetical protein LPJ61_006795 [Coemansia biformis]|uniref:HMG box domain-containing protein n=1 Tax=Coemansia biformis TaxID=1286918 RepID=A0A9W7XSD6_9FUNG|nr:hypothetical protein LPJ61_006795 [Coemansia biformis]